MRIRRTIVLMAFAAVVTWSCTPPEPAAEALEYVEVVVGDAPPDTALPLYIGIHGLGDRPEIFGRTFFAEFPIAARFVFPRAPVAHGGGFSWFEIPSTISVSESRIGDGVRAAGDRVAALIEDLAGGSPTRPVVFGYSQGGMIAFYLAAERSDLVAAAVPISGFLPNGGRSKGTPADVFAYHGSRDELVPVSAARASIESLRARGGRAELVEDPNVGHAISLALVRQVSEKLVDLAGTADVQPSP